jgi:DNA (cytosine-5)-methyltransferase 1
MYTIFWKKGGKAPDLDIRPTAHCPKCDKNVNAIQTFKKSYWGRYDSQYFYRCPVCTSKVIPYYYAAFNAIDWTVPSVKIKDRKRELQPKTIARIEYGFKAYGRKPMIISPRYGTGDRVHDAQLSPLPTQPGDASHAVVFPWLIETGHSMSGDGRAYSSIDSMPTQTSRQTLGVAFVAEMHGTSKASDITDPLACVTAGGNHHALLSTDAFLTYYYGSQNASSITEPVHTMTGVERAALVNGMTIDDLSFRMLQAHEIGKAMAFPSTYIVKGTQRDQVKQYGNAVTPPAMEMLIKRCLATL